MEAVCLEHPDGRLIEAKSIRNPDLGIDTWGLECPDCGEWTILYGTQVPEWELDEHDRLTVDRPLSCRSPLCDYVFRIENGRIVEP